MRKDYKNILIVLTKFFLVYLILLFFYNLYIHHYEVVLNTCDPYTIHVSDISARFIDYFISPNAQSYVFKNINSGCFYINNQFCSYVTEGCNAISVMILFVSFIIAFSQGFKKTSLFIIFGLLILYLSNIIRIGVINYVIFLDKSLYREIHDFIFPIIIYGVVIVLWLIWIKYFSNFKAKAEITKEKKNLRILLISLSLLGLVLVRFFENLFYDPFLSFYKHIGSKDSVLPEFNSFKLLFSLFLRYCLNAFLSISILFLWFNNKKIIKPLIFLYSFIFILFGSIYYFSLTNNLILGYMPTFYIRRILIQPILLLILIPTLYYVRSIKKK